MLDCKKNKFNFRLIKKFRKFSLIKFRKYYQVYFESKNYLFGREGGH